MKTFLDFINEELDEAIVRVVRTDSSGKRRIMRVKDKKTRTRQATQTTGRTTAERKRSARLAAKARKRDARGTAKAIRKRKITMRRRKSMLGAE